MDETAIGVCGWSIDRYDILRSIEVAGSELGLKTVHVGLCTAATLSETDPATIRRAAERWGVRLVAPFVYFDGEDSSSIERIAETGGYMADDPYPQRLELTGRVGQFARDLGCEAVAVHAGTVHPETDSPSFDKLVGRTSEVAAMLADLGLRLLIETGRESADALLAFIEATGRDDIGVSFDPANFVVYGTDNPTKAFSKLKALVEVVHMKDAFSSERPGVDYGRPAPLGAGDAHIPRIVNKLRLAGYTGPLLIEANTRALGPDAIQHAADYLRSMLA